MEHYIPEALIAILTPCVTGVVVALIARMVSPK